MGIQVGLPGPGTGATDSVTPLRHPTLNDFTSHGHPVVSGCPPFCPFTFQVSILLVFLAPYCCPHSLWRVFPPIVRWSAFVKPRLPDFALPRHEPLVAV